VNVRRYPEYLCCGSMAIYLSFEYKLESQISTTGTLMRAMIF